MRELLRVAGDESQQEPWARVHAINTLRLTFSDRNLANDVSGFFAEGTAFDTRMLFEVPCKHDRMRHCITKCMLKAVAVLLDAFMHVKACKDAYRPRGTTSYTSLCCMTC